MFKTFLSASAAMLLAAPALAVTFTSTPLYTPANPFVIDGFEAPVHRHRLFGQLQPEQRVDLGHRRCAGG